MHNQIHTVDGLGGVTEAVLFKQAQAGCGASLNQLMSRHKRLVPFVVRRQTLGKLPFAEAMQAGRIGLWKAILGYDRQRGYAFSTYACTAIARHIWQAVKRAERITPESKRVVPTVTRDETDPVVVWETSAVSTALQDAVERLPERLRDIIMARYGLSGKSATTYREIGATLGLTGERIRQLHTEALVWLRQPAHSQYLRALLERHTVADYEAAEALAQSWLRWRGGRRER